MEKFTDMVRRVGIEPPVVGVILRRVVTFIVCRCDLIRRISHIVTFTGS